MEHIPKEKLKEAPDLFDLSGKTAVITGGSRGLGRGMALALASCGVDVALVSRTQSELEFVASEIREVGRRALAISADVADETKVKEVVETVLTEFDRIDILINSAGIVALKPIAEFEVESLQNLRYRTWEFIFFCSIFLISPQPGL